MRAGRRVEIALAALLVVAVGGLAVGRAFRASTNPTSEAGVGRTGGSLQCLQDLAAAGSVEGATIGDDLGALTEAVEDVRELRFTDPPEPTYLPRSEFSRRVASYADEYSDRDAEEDERILTALAAIEPGTDLKALLRAALGEQVAGFYDPDTRELVVGASEPSALSFLERVTLAHELQHALADQTLGLPLEREDVPEGEEDAQAAATALVEGDATLTMTLVSLRLAGDPGALFGEGLGALGGPSTELPFHIQRSLLFPYEEGLTFTCSLYSEGGWDAVDAAYRRPPGTTAEVLYPERYGRGDRVADPEDPVSPGEGWTFLTRQAMGAAELLFLFEAPGGDAGTSLSDPKGRASAWRGGEVHVWERGADSIVVAAFEGARGLCGSIRAWQRAAGGAIRETGALTESRTSGGVTVVACSGSEVRIGVAPDPAAARRVAA